MKFARAFLKALALAVWTGTLIPVQALAVALRLPIEGRVPMLYHRGVARLLGMKVIAIGQRASARPTLFVVNHSSWLDITVIDTLMPICFVAKREVNSWPVFGLLARLQRTVFVERRAQRTAVHKDEMTERLNAGDNLVLFPEGTSSDGNHVLPFKSAFFALAETRVKDVPLTVQPVSVAYTAIDGLPIGRDRRPELTWFGDMELAPHLWGVLCLDRFTVTVQFHAPVTIESFASRKELAAHCQAVVSAGLSDALSGRVQLPAPRRRLLARRPPQP
jgi:1-acyl-sn-glycerol-3-phosphate acyltransferase